jgi:predicted amidohydrolase
MADAASPTPDFAIAVAQFAPGADAVANLAEIARLTELAAARGARLVVFPEYSSYFTPEPGWDWHAAAEEVGGRFTEHLSALSTRLDLHVVAGMIERLDGDERRVANTVVAVAQGAGVVARYRKLHLYDAFGQRESEWVAPGAIEAPQLFEAGGIRFGLQTCYDARFPEVTRRIVDAGADVVCMPAEWVRGPLKEAHWRVLTTARALENTMYVAAADHAPPVGAGNSMIVDPMGVELATIGEATDVAVAWISRARIDAVRRINPALALRRFDVTERVADPRDPR